ncbi:hypothetical protein [Clostridium sp.]|uniref:hypothetical protein n=1 Tax=Clostridium sp. TaxID=1506 RepID=UPI003F30B79A
MEIGQASERELLSLWKETEETMKSITHFFYNNTKAGSVEFWTLNKDNEFAHGYSSVFENNELTYDEETISSDLDLIIDSVGYVLKGGLL